MRRSFHPVTVAALVLSCGPPDRRPGDEDRGRFLAIGERDRMTLVFRKARGNGPERATATDANPD